jgi:hypothetical protein
VLNRICIPFLIMLLSMNTRGTTISTIDYSRLFPLLHGGAASETTLEVRLALKVALDHRCSKCWQKNSIIRSPLTAECP